MIYTYICIYTYACITYIIMFISYIHIYIMHIYVHVCVSSFSDFFVCLTTYLIKESKKNWICPLKKKKKKQMGGLYF